MRKACLNAVFELAKKDERVIFIGSDIGYGVLDEFKKSMPGRFFMEGIAEANVVGMAAGLAMEGKIPYINTIAPFFTRRCYEQIMLDLCFHNVNVRFIGNGGGLVYAPLGPTHLAFEDIAAMRSIPNLTIVAPADAEEMTRFMEKTIEHKGPIYIRLAKGYDPVVTNRHDSFEIGKAIQMKNGEDAVVISTGITLKIALDASKKLSDKGVNASVIHVHTLKPLDSKMIQETIEKIPVVVTIEEHSIIGGLGSAVAEIISEANFNRPKRFRRIGIPDTFPDEYGSQDSLMERYSITENNLVQTIHQLINL